MTYVLVNAAAFVALLIAYVVLRPTVHIRALVSTCIGLTLLTVVFDNLIIAADIVAYHQSNILGIYLYKMPIEDISYTLAACLLVPLLWGKETPKNVE